jgi:hypothetical protein
MVQLLKERDEELERLAEENERLTAEIETYALVLQGCMEAQDPEHERNRAAAIRVSKEWNDITTSHGATAEFCRSFPGEES